MLVLPIPSATDLGAAARSSRGGVYSMHRGSAVLCLRQRRADGAGELVLTEGLLHGRRAAILVAQPDRAVAGGEDERNSPRLERRGHRIDLGARDIDVEDGRIDGLVLGEPQGLV